MAYPMIALTTGGTAFACASVSLTETGLAVLDEDGSREGFVPYDSLEYVAPTEESRVEEAPMQVLVEDGSSFGAASVSQAAKGVAVLDASGSRIGFVPYDTLTHVLPESKTGPTLPADATPLESVNVEEEDDGGGPVWKGDEERAATEEGEEDEEEDEEDEEDEEQEADDTDSTVDRSGNDSDPHPTPDENDAESEAEEESGTEPDETASTPDEGDRDVGTDDDGPVWGGEPEERSERGEGESSTEPGSDDGAKSTTEQRTDGAGEASSTPSEDAGARDGEREEEAEESELVVEWSFGDE